MPLFIVKQDISKINVDAVVCETGMTENQSVGNISVFDKPDGRKKYSISVKTPSDKDIKLNFGKLIDYCYKETLKVIKEYNISSVAFPLFGMKNGKYSQEELLKIAKKTINEYVKENDILIYLVIEDKKIFGVGSKLFSDIEKYVNNHYVEMRNSYYKKTEENYSTTQRNNIKNKSLEELMKKSEETFSQMLLRIIQEKGLTDVQAYRKANVDRKLFSKIRGNPLYKPSKRTIFCFAIALELTMSEAEELLRKAGFAFSNCFKDDVIVSYFIENRKYDIYEINDILFQYDLPLLGSAWY